MSRFEIRNEPPPGELEEALLDAAFGMERRTKTSYRLREGSAPVEGLQFSAWDSASGRLAGVVSLWPLKIAPAGEDALLLGPLAVHPDFQNDGLGSALIRVALDAARERGHGLVFLVGDAPYYQRHGFQQVPRGRIQLPGPFDPARLLYLPLRAGAFDGVRGLLLPAYRFTAAEAVDCTRSSA